MNLIEMIDYTQMQTEADLLMEMANYIYKEYTMLSEISDDFFTEADDETPVPSTDTTNDPPKKSEEQSSSDDNLSLKKKKLGSKLVDMLKKIWGSITKWVDKVVSKIKNGKTKKDVERVTSMTAEDINKLDQTLSAALTEVKNKKGGTVTQEFGDVGIANMRDISNFVDIDQYEHKMKHVSSNSLKRQAVGHGVTLASMFIVAPPILDAIAGTIFVGYEAYQIIMTLKDAIDYMKLAMNKHSIYGNIPTWDKLRSAITAMNEKLSKISMIMPGNPKRVTEIRATEVLNQIKIHDSTYHPVFRQIEYFYEKDIKSRKIFKMKMENQDIDIKNRKLVKRDAKTFIECVNFLRGIDLQTQRLLNEFKAKATMVSESLNSKSMEQHTKSNPMLSELLRTSQDALKMISIFYVFSTIGGDTAKLLCAAADASKKGGQTSASANKNAVKQPMGRTIEREDEVYA